MQVQFVARLWRESRISFTLALPIIIGQVTMLLMNIIDTVLSGHLSTKILAAVTMGYQIWIIVLLVIVGLMLALTPTVSQLDGAGERHAIGHTFRQSLWLALVMGIVGVFVIQHASPLLVWIGVEAEIIPDAILFLKGISWAAPALAVLCVCKNLSEGLSLTRPTMYFSGLGVVVLLPCAYALMYGAWGFPRLEAYGAGIAHAIALMVQAGAFLLYVMRRRIYHEACLFERFDWPDWRVQKQLLMLGIPMGTALFMEGGLFVATALLMGALGKVPAGAHAIAINVASTAFMVPLGIGMATTVRVGHAVGRKDYQGVKWAVIAGLVLMLCTQTLSASMMVFLAEHIVVQYTRDMAVITMAVVLLHYAALFQFPDGIQAVINCALRGLKDTTVPALMTIVAYWLIGFGLSWFLCFKYHWGGVGLWTGLITGLTAAAALLSWRFMRTMRFLRRELEGTS